MADPDLRTGEKIKELRLARGLTQAELAGDRITRNMLSMIENGTASPSLETLVYLGKRLGTPAGYFIPASRDEEEKLGRLTVIDGLRRAYADGKWNDCVSLAEGCTPDDEISYILACAYLKLSFGALEEYDVRSALDFIGRAEECACGSVYCGESFASAAEYHRLLALNLATDEIPDGLCDARGCGEYLSASVPVYFISLKCLREGEENPFPFTQTKLHEEHLIAASLAMEEEYTEAIRRLRCLADNTELPPYMRFRVLCDLESAADITGNARLAYNTARQKLDMINKCRI